MLGATISVAIVSQAVFKSMYSMAIQRPMSSLQCLLEGIIAGSWLCASEPSCDVYIRPPLYPFNRFATVDRGTYVGPVQRVVKWEDEEGNKYITVKVKLLWKPGGWKVWVDAGMWIKVLIADAVFAWIVSPNEVKEWCQEDKLKKVRTNEGAATGTASVCSKHIGWAEVAAAIFEYAFGHPVVVAGSAWTPSKHYGRCGEQCLCCREARKENNNCCELCQLEKIISAVSVDCKKAVENFYSNRYGREMSGGQNHILQRMLWAGEL